LFSFTLIPNRLFPFLSDNFFYSDQSLQYIRKFYKILWFWIIFFNINYWYLWIRKFVQGSKNQLLTSFYCASI